MAVLIPLSGWIARRHGGRRIFLLAIAIFTGASLACALSPTLSVLVVMRVIQGVGAAMMVPVGRLSVLQGIAKTDVIRAIALLTWPALIAPVLAPPLGGLFTTYLSWEWIFLVNVPLGVAAFVLAMRLIPQIDSPPPPPLDWWGLILTCSAVAALVSLADLLAASTQRRLPVVVLSVAGVGLSAVAIRHLMRTRHPLLDLQILRIRTFRVPHNSGGLYRLTISAVPFLLPLMFQDAFGWSPLKAGNFVLFVFLGNVAIKPATTWMLRQFGFRMVLVVATGCAALSMVLAGLLTASTPAVVVALALTFGGVARSVGFTAYATITFADIEPGSLAHANTLSATIQQIAAGFGVAVGAVLLRVGDAVAGSSAAVPDACGVALPIHVLHAGRADADRGDRRAAAGPRGRPVAAGGALRRRANSCGSRTFYIRLLAWAISTLPSSPPLFPEFTYTATFAPGPYRPASPS